MEEYLSSEDLLKRYERNDRTIENAWINGLGLQGADLRGITLRNARLHEVDLSEANLSGAYFEHVTIEFAHLQKTNLMNAILRNVMIHYSNLSGVIFQGANLQQIIFEPSTPDNRIDLSNANLSYATLVGVNLRYANLFRTNLTAAYLSDVDFSGADLRQVLIGRTNQENVKRDAATLWEPISVPDPSATRARNRNTETQRGSIVIESVQSPTDYITIPGDKVGMPLEYAKKQVFMMLQERFGRAGRSGQAKFRADMFHIYQGRCAITGCRLEPILEAAHIYPHCLRENHSSTNGILLRCDLHELFDWNLLKIDPVNKQILIDPSIEDEEYRRFHGKIVAEPFAIEFVNQAWLRMIQWRWDEYHRLVAGFNPKHRYSKNA